MYQVRKRDGKITEFDLKKIAVAITSAFEAQKKQYHPSIIDMLALKVTASNAGTIEAEAKKHGKSSSDHGHWIWPGEVLTIPG